MKTTFLILAFHLVLVASPASANNRLNIEYLAFAYPPTNSQSITLSDSGYLSVSRVISPGEFAVRGGIIDVYPSGSEKPFRIDLFGNEIEKIRFFDPESQKSIGETNSLSILPAREFPTDQIAIDRFRANYRRTFAGDPQNSIIYRDVSQGKFP